MGQIVAELLGVARRRGLETSATTDLIGRAVDAIDELLVATVRAWEMTLRTTKEAQAE